MRIMTARIRNIKLGGDIEYIRDLLKKGGFTLEIISVQETGDEKDAN